MCKVWVETQDFSVAGRSRNWVGKHVNYLGKTTEDAFHCGLFRAPCFCSYFRWYHREEVRLKDKFLRETSWKLIYVNPKTLPTKHTFRNWINKVPMKKPLCWLQSPSHVKKLVDKIYCWFICGTTVIQISNKCKHYDNTGKLVYAVSGLKPLKSTVISELGSATDMSEDASFPCVWVLVAWHQKFMCPVVFWLAEAALMSSAVSSSSWPCWGILWWEYWVSI